MNGFEVIEKIKAETGLKIRIGSSLRDVDTEIVEPMVEDVSVEVKHNEIEYMRVRDKIEILKPYFKYFKNIKILEFFGIPLGNDLEFLGHCKRLTSLTIQRVGLKRVPECVCNLKNLEYLALSQNQLSELPDAIGNLTNLKILYLWENDFTDLPKSISKLTNLTELSLIRTNIANLPSPVFHLTNLIKLFISQTEIKTIPHEISKLKKLEVLYMSPSKMDTFPSAVLGLKSIKHLDLSYNVFESIPKEILNLGLPFIRNNDALTYEESGILMYDLQLQEMDANMFSKDRKHIEEYYNELEKEQPILLNETRVIFIGNGDAGKTSIIRRLITGEFEKISGGTKGILIEKHDFEIIDEKGPRTTTVNFWDFGGQEIMHSMHEFFLSERCLYIVVLDGRRDERPEKWLDLVKQYGKDSPVMVVMNKMDQPGARGVDEVHYRREYKKHFPQLYFSNISCESGENFDKFKSDFLEFIKNTKAYNKRFPARWARIKKALTEMQDNVNYIDESQFGQYCNNEGITNPFNQKILLEWLNDLGVCFNYKSKNLIGAVDEFKVLRPEWITNGIYKIITSKKSQDKNGFLPHGLVKEILTTEEGENAKYNNIEKDFILGMMRDFELSFTVDNTEFIPMLAQKNEPEEIPIDYNKAVHFKIDYGESLPTAILYQFVVRMERHINPKYTWVRGCFLEDKQNHKFKALVRFGKNSNELQIYVEGESDAVTSHLSHIRLQLGDIQKRIKLTPKEYIEYHHTNGDKVLIDYNRALHMMKLGNATDFIYELGEHVPLVEVLKFYNPQLTREILENTINEQRNKLKQHGDVNELLRKMRAMVELLDATSSGLLSRLEKTTTALEKSTTLQIEQFEKVQSFLDTNKDAIDNIGNDELLTAIKELRHAIDKKDEQSAKEKSLKLMSVLSDVITVGSTIAKAGSVVYKVANSPVTHGIIQGLSEVMIALQPYM
ncbi:MAG: leucine-rich repeat domain-containing protein [Defluviitaleaceae bacterium]|nr:leucine-rich repeat domain-containing protein [Defluviitaleaceae bacterium]